MAGKRRSGLRAGRHCAGNGEGLRGRRQPARGLQYRGKFYVTDDECTHAAASLADGMLEGDVIECCVHFGAFDVKTGAVKAPPCQVALRTYKVVLQGDDVYVDLDRDAAGEPA